MKTARLDEIAAEEWPYWAPIRHHFGISTFGINAWRAAAGDEAIKRHDHAESGEPELYLVLRGGATFTVDGEEVAAPEGTLIWIENGSAERVCVATEDGTVVLSIGAGTPGEAFAPSGWDTDYLEGS